VTLTLGREGAPQIGTRIPGCPACSDGEPENLREDLLNPMGSRNGTASLHSPQYREEVDRCNVRYGLGASRRKGIRLESPDNC
jgi:hypothetical protein